MIIERPREQEIIAKAISKRKNLFVYGSKGVGKSFMVRRIIENLKGRNIFYSGDCSSLKNALLGLLKDVYADSFLCRQNTLALKKLFYKIIEGEKPYLVFDHIGRIAPKFFSFLEYVVMERRVPLIIVSRGLRKEHIGQLETILYDFMKIEIDNLNRPAADRLMGRLIARPGVNITKKNKFKKDVFYYSKGNPKIIQELCLLASDTKYKPKGFLGAKFLDLDRRINELLSPNAQD